jgi:signal transduction histidine kinase
MPVFRRRVRSRRIRFFLIGMFAVPLVSVVGLWAFLTSITVNTAISNHNFSSSSRAITSKGAALSLGLTEERAQTYLWLAAGRKTAKNSMLATRTLVNGALAAARNSLGSGGLPLTAEAESALHAFYSDLGHLPAIRAGVDSGRTSPLAAFQAYSGIIDAEFRYYYSSILDTGGTLAQPSIGAADAAYADEMANREVVLADGALADMGSLGADAVQVFTGAAASRRLLMTEVTTLLPPSMSAPYVSIERSAPYRQFQAMENLITSGVGGSGPIPVRAGGWQTASSLFLTSMLKAELNSGGQLAAAATAVADRSVTEAAVAGGLGLAAVIASIFLMAWFARKLTRDLRDLDSGVRAIADERLPWVVERLRRGDDVDVAAESPAPSASTIAEISQIATSFATVQKAAVEAAVDQARLRKGVSQVFLNISMRNQSLLHRQLGMLDSMERRTSEPGALADLFRLDHLILSGSTPARGWRNPVPIVDVLRAAVAEVEDYVRVDVLSESRDLVAGNAVNDVIHLFAELIENATVFSPPNTRIEVRADRVGNGLAAEIEDRGLGLADDELADINRRLARPAEFDLADSEQLGLFVVSRLTTRHGITVTLRRSVYGGTTAILLLPFGVVVRAEDAYSAGALEAPGAPGSRAQEDRPDAGDAGDAGGAGGGPPWQPDAAGPVPSASEPQRQGGLRHRLRSAATGRRADDGAMEVPPRPRPAPAPAPAPADDGVTEVPPQRPSGAAAPWQGAAMTPWPDAFRPQTTRRGAPDGDESQAVGPGRQPLTTPASAGQPPAAGPASSQSHLGMPVRVPQASLAPQLRALRESGSQPAARQAPGAAERSPEATRDMLILMQDGWQRGRLDDLDEPGEAPDNETATSAEGTYGAD